MNKMMSNNIDVSPSAVILETSKTKLALAETELANLEKYFIRKFACNFNEHLSK